MKQFIAISVLVGFAAIALFGFFAMQHTITDHGNCAASLANGAICPDGDPLTMVSFHAHAFQTIATAAFSNPLISLFFILSLAIILIGFLIQSSFSGVPTALRLLFASPPVFLIIRHIDWLSLHEHSPSLT